MVEHSETSEAGHPGDGQCHCVCHQTLVHQHPAAEFCPGAFKEVSLVIDAPDSSPEAVPVEIDHPPQLA